MPNMNRIGQQLCCENGIFENFEENSKSKKVTKPDRIKKNLKTSAELLRYCSNIAAYKIRNGSVNNFIIQKHYKFDIRQTDGQMTDTKFFIAISEFQGSKTCRKKTSAQSEGK